MNLLALRRTGRDRSTPLECAQRFAKLLFSGNASPALELAAAGVRRLRAAEGPIAVNAWVVPGRHWRIEVLPRLTILAGLELGAGYFVNTTAPESAAGILREA